MRQVSIHSFGDPSVLRLEEVPDPSLSPGEVLVDVHYAGLNPLDHKMRDGSSARARQLTLPCSLGREFSGRLVAAAPDVDLRDEGLAVGDWVFGMRGSDDWRGCYAERITIDRAAVAKVPDEGRATLPAFAGLPIAGTTAVTAIEQARIVPGETVLIHGGTGGVGQMLVPLALMRGAKVWATGRAANAERIRELGARPIPYDATDWREMILDATDGRGVDVIIDTHSFQPFLPSLDHLADGGRIVALPTLADLTPAHERGIEASIPSPREGRDTLDMLARTLVSGRLPVEVSEVFALSDVARAHAQLEHGHTRGKLVLDTRV